MKLAASGPRRENIEAYQSYLKGVYHYQRYTPEGLAKAKEFFEQALTHGPNYAPAYGGLAGYYYTIAGLNIRPMTEMAPSAKSAAERALAIDPTLSEALSVLGVVSAMFEYDWKGAEREFQMAMAREPVLPVTRFRYGLYFLIPRRRLEEAVEQFEQALETDPLSMVVHFILAFTLYLVRGYDSAIERAARALEINANFWLIHLAIGIGQLQKGSIQEAIASLEKTLALSPWYSPGVGYLAAAYVRAGNRGHAAKLIPEFRERNPGAYCSPICSALYHASLGEVDPMFESLRAALADRDPYLTRFHVEPLFAFRSDPRYRDLLSRMNLE